MLHLSPVMPTPPADALRDKILADREARTGVSHYAVVSDRQRTTTDWQAIARGLGATEQLIAKHTKVTDFQQVDTYAVPSVAELLALFDRNLVVADIETTGLSPIVDRILTIGAVPGHIEDASSIMPPKMPMMKRPAPIGFGRPDIVIDVGRHGSPQPPATRQGVLAGIKKPEGARPAQEPDRPPMRMAKVPPRPTGPDKFDDEVTF